MKATELIILLQAYVNERGDVPLLMKCRHDENTYHELATVQPICEGDKNEYALLLDYK